MYSCHWYNKNIQKIGADIYFDRESLSSPCTTHTWPIFNSVAYKYGFIEFGDLILVIAFFVGTILALHLWKDDRGL